MRTLLLQEGWEQCLSYLDNIKKTHVKCWLSGSLLSGASRKKEGAAKGFLMVFHQEQLLTLTALSACCDVISDLSCVLPGLIRVQLFTHHSMAVLIFLK